MFQTKCLPGSAIFLFALILASCQPAPQPPAVEPKPEAATEAPPVEAPPEIAAVPAVPPKPMPQRLFPESAIVAPAINAASRRIAYDTLLASRSADGKSKTAWQYRRNPKGHIIGFEFSNSGGNPTLPPRRDAPKNQFFTRDFQFRFDDRARQDIHLMISDWVPSRDRQFRLSELMNSLMHFFPRTVLPAIVNFGERNIVTLPTGEEVEFNAATNEIVGGVLSEAPVDLNPDGRSRRFPAVIYKGRGIMVRADARGADPRLSPTASILNNAATAECSAGSPCAQCQVPSRELWEQSGAVRFKFATDQDFARYLLGRCAFGLPTLHLDVPTTTAIQ